ncbi:MAG TPA: enoyl-CoA hydratase-related protein, partial [Clostridia bacterium]|nr:enoyl-CoA hydratase-related protein [Clostridia bacterium]
FDLIMTGRRIKAQEAKDLGLVLDVIPADLLLDRAWDLASSIAQKAPVAIREAKRAIRDGLDLTLTEGLTLEEVAFGRCFETQDQKKAMEAFVNKGEMPIFVGF